MVSRGTDPEPSEPRTGQKAARFHGEKDRMLIRVKDVPLTIQGGLVKVLFVTTWPSRGPGSPGRVPALLPEPAGGVGQEAVGTSGVWPHRH